MLDIAMSNYPAGQFIWCTRKWLELNDPIGVLIALGARLPHWLCSQSAFGDSLRLRGGL